jgi:hypothetical protein
MAILPAHTSRRNVSGGWIDLHGIGQALDDEGPAALVLFGFNVG